LYASAAECKDQRPRFGNAGGGKKKRGGKAGCRGPHCRASLQQSIVNQRDKGERNGRVENEIYIHIHLTLLLPLVSPHSIAKLIIAAPGKESLLEEQLWGE
jgi:hypothetical protein